LLEGYRYYMPTPLDGGLLGGPLMPAACGLRPAACGLRPAGRIWWSGHPRTDDAQSQSAVARGTRNPLSSGSMEEARWTAPPPTSKTPSLVRQWKSPPPRSRIRQFRLRQRRAVLPRSSYPMILNYPKGLRVTFFPTSSPLLAEPGVRPLRPAARQYESQCAGSSWC
jgi:hypothetical protein